MDILHYNLLAFCVQLHYTLLNIYWAENYFKHDL